MPSLPRTAVLAAAAAALLASSASAQYTIYQTDPLTIAVPTAGPASVYPTSVWVGSDLFPYVTAERVTITLHALTHTWPDDLDIMLRNSSYGITVMLMSDAGGSIDITGQTITLDPAALTVLPDAGPITTGAYRPADYEPGESVPAPAPAAPYDPLSALQGFIPLNGWDLYIADDTAQDGGSLAAWSMTIYPAQTNRWVANNAGAVVPDVGPAATYPLTLNVYGVDAPVAWMSTNIRLRHDYPEDLDILLVAPDGTSCMLMSDAGGATATAYTELSWRAPTIGTPANIPSPLPTFVSNAAPTNLGAGADVLPVPAPPAPHGSSMTPMLTTNPNGTWKLFVYDDTSPDPGTISYWAIQINGQTFCNADFNKSGAVSVQDIFDFLAAYFAGCP